MDRITRGKPSYTVKAAVHFLNYEGYRGLTKYDVAYSSNRDRVLGLERKRGDTIIITGVSDAGNLYLLNADHTSFNLRDVKSDGQNGIRDYGVKH